MWLLVGLSMLAGLACLARRKPQAMAIRLRVGLLATCVIALALGMAACGGGGSSAGPGPSNPGTPAGTYSIVVTGAAISGSTTLTHNVTLTLGVK